MTDDEGTCYEIVLEDWHVVAPPVWNDFFPQARNWLAVVEADGRAPGGVSRTWCPRRRGRLRYNVMGFVEGDLVEFGADTIMRSGRRIENRWYGEIVRIDEHAVRCRHYEILGEMLSTVRDRAERTKEWAESG